MMYEAVCGGSFEIYSQSTLALGSFCGDYVLNCEQRG